MMEGHFVVYIGVLLCMFEGRLSFNTERRRVPGNSYSLFGEPNIVSNNYRHFIGNNDDLVEKYPLNEDRAYFKNHAAELLPGVADGELKTGHNENFDDTDITLLLEYINTIDDGEPNVRPSRRPRKRSVLDPIEHSGSGFRGFGGSGGIPKRKLKFTFKNLLPYLKENIRRRSRWGRNA